MTIDQKMRQISDDYPSALRYETKPGHWYISIDGEEIAHGGTKSYVTKYAYAKLYRKLNRHESEKIVKEYAPLAVAELIGDSSGGPKIAICGKEETFSDPIAIGDNFSAAWRSAAEKLMLSSKTNPGIYSYKTRILERYSRVDAVRIQEKIHVLVDSEGFFDLPIGMGNTYTDAYRDAADAIETGRDVEIAMKYLATDRRNAEWLIGVPPKPRPLLVISADTASLVCRRIR